MAVTPFSKPASITSELAQPHKLYHSLSTPQFLRKSRLQTKLLKLLLQVTADPKPAVGVVTENVAALKLANGKNESTCIVNWPVLVSSQDSGTTTPTVVGMPEKVKQVASEDLEFAAALKRQCDWRHSQSPSPSTSPTLLACPSLLHSPCSTPVHSLAQCHPHSPSSSASLTLVHS
jgi:hypothetical protein